MRSPRLTSRPHLFKKEGWRDFGDRGTKFAIRERPCENIAQLRKTLAALPARLDKTTIAKNQAFITHLGRHENVRRLVWEILESPTLLREIARQSYRHVNHFDKIVLVGNDDPAAYRLTMHLWRPPYTEDELCEELIHDHRFSFWSVILSGILISENFVRSDQAGSVFRQYRYIPESRSRTFRDFYQFHGETRLLQNLVKRAASGKSYYLSAPTIHRIILPRSSVTCTLVLRGPRLRNYSTVFNTTYPSENTQLDNSMFTPEELAARLIVVLRTLRNGSSPDAGLDISGDSDFRVSRLAIGPRKPAGRLLSIDAPLVDNTPR